MQARMDLCVQDLPHVLYSRGVLSLLSNGHTVAFFICLHGGCLSCLMTMRLWLRLQGALLVPPICRGYCHQGLKSNHAAHMHILYARLQPTVPTSSSIIQLKCSLFRAFPVLGDEGRCMVQSMGPLLSEKIY